MMIGVFLLSVAFSGLGDDLDSPDNPGRVGVLRFIILASGPSRDQFSGFPGMMVESTLRRNLPKERLEVHRFEIGEDVGAFAEQIEEQVTTSSLDTVLVYYFGDGTAEPATGDMLLGVGERRLDLRQFKVELKRRLNPRLLILLTDRAVVHQQATAAASSISSPPGEVPTGFRRLFFEAQGVVDIRGCSAGQVGTATVRLGTAFLPEPAFTKALTGRLWANLHSPTVSWQSLASEVGRETSRLFQASFPDGLSVATGQGDQVRQTTQTPVVELTGAVKNAKPNVPNAKPVGGAKKAENKPKK